MAINFPDAPIVGATFLAPTGVTYAWDGTKWAVDSSGASGSLFGTTFGRAFEQLVPSGTADGTAYTFTFAVADLPPGSFYWQFTFAVVSEDSSVVALNGTKGRMATGYPVSNWRGHILADVSDGAGKIWRYLGETVMWGVGPYTASSGFYPNPGDPEYAAGMFGKVALHTVGQTIQIRITKVAWAGEVVGANTVTLSFSARVLAPTPIVLSSSSSELILPVITAAPPPPGGYRLP